MTLSRYVLGLDLGRQIDRTAICLVDALTDTFDVVYLSAFRPVREDMSDVVGRVLDVVEHPRVGADTVSVVVDSQGVGRRWVDMARRTRLATLCPIIALVPVGNSRAPGQGRGGIVFAPKTLMVETVVRVAAEGRIRFARGLKHEAELREELKHYREKQRADGFRTYANDLRSDHDDLVSSMVYSTWYAEDRRLRGVAQFRPYQEGFHAQ